MIAAREWVVLAFGASLLLAAPACGQDRLPRALLADIGPCAEAQLDGVLLVERLRVELHAEGIDEVRMVRRGPPLSRAASDGVWVVRIELENCEAGSGVFVARVEDRRGTTLAEHRIELGGTTLNARERALALALAELLRGTRPNADGEPAPGAVAEPRAGASAAVEGRERAQERESRAGDGEQGGSSAASAERTELAPVDDERDRATAFSAAFVVRAFPGGRVAPLGGRLAVDIAVFAPLVVRVDAEAGAGLALDPIGRIDLGLATGGVGLAWAARMGRDVRLLLGARLAVGVGWAQGQPYDADTPSRGGAGPIVTAGAMLELDVHAVGPLALRFGAEVGAVAGGLEARVAAIPVAGITGAMLAASAGLALAD